MGIRACGLAVAVAVLAAPASAAGKTIVAPDWLERPTPEQFAEHYPGAAQALEIEGQATIACQIDVEGHLADCKVLSEAPADLGFGAAAVAMSDGFRMKPQIEDGRPVGGADVRIPIRFRLPQTDQVGPPPEASAEALGPALRAVDGLEAVDHAIDGSVAELEGAPPAGVSASVQKAAVDALRTAWAGHREELRDSYARAFASVYSETELAGIAAFAEGPGKALANGDASLNAAFAQAATEMARTLRGPALAAFCAKVACPTAAELERVWRPVEARDGRLDNPQWDFAPNADEIALHAPAPAGFAGIAGAVRLTCGIEKTGELDGCVVDEELPRGLGFGVAALELSKAYRLSGVQLAAGAAGRKATVRIGFPPPRLAEPYAAPKPRSAAALELGRKLVVANESVEAVRRDVEVQILAFETPKGADEKTYAALVDAYRTGVLAAAETAADTQARIWAAYHDEAELAALVSFQASPAGKAMRDRTGAMEIATGKAYVFVASKVTAEARAVFCKTHACEAPPPAQAATVKPEASTRKP